MDKKFVLLLILLITPGFSRVLIEKSAPKEVDVGAKGMVVLEIKANSSVSSLNVVEEIPLPVKIEEWSVSGYDEKMVFFEERQEGTTKKHRWNFRQGFSPGEHATLTYFFSSPSAGSYNLTTIYLYPSGFDRKITTVKVSDSRNLVFLLVVVSLVLLVSLYLTQRARKGERKIFSFFRKILKKERKILD